MVIERSLGFVLSPALTLRGRTLPGFGEGLSGVASSWRSFGVISSARRRVPGMRGSCTLLTNDWAHRVSENSAI